MEFNIGLDVIITLVIAIYGALLSTYSLWTARQEHRREIKVVQRYGFIRNPLSGVGPPLLILSALNTGTKTITLSSVGLILPGTPKYLLFVQPDSNVRFPYDLPEGKDCSVWVTHRELAEDLKREGYSGKIKLKGYYRDAVGHEYKSKSAKFDIEKAYRENGCERP